MIRTFDALEGKTIVSAILFSDKDVVGTSLNKEDCNKYSLLITTDDGVFSIEWSDNAIPTIVKETVVTI